jgi:putative restriction endonuclease
MILAKVQDIFSLSAGDTVSKRNLFELIQFSKVKNSNYWSGQENSIGNTPQQGINWVGELPAIRALIIKARLGSYEEDGWSDMSKNKYKYSFKAKKGEIIYTEKANRALINQPEYFYPIFLFTESRNGWRFEGDFSVTDIENKFVVLSRNSFRSAPLVTAQDENLFKEGGRKYVTHLMAERSRAVVDVLKKNKDWVCDICEEDFHYKYNVNYIEAHHKVPLATYASTYNVTTSDLALLCPNCHRAVHIYMKAQGLEYQMIKKILTGAGDS